MDSFIPCVEKHLDPALAEGAADLAIQCNPNNRPAVEALTASGLVLAPSHLALLTSRYWPSGGVQLTVGFLEPIAEALANKIVAAMNRWSPYANIKFTRTRTDPQVRITREGQGYWSYIGTDILSIPRGEPTMCFQAFTEKTPESEFIRVPPHEAGHAAGFVHEHMRRDIVKQIDPNKAIPYFLRTQGWNAQMVRQQVLQSLEEATLRGTPIADEASIMCYWLPGEITYSGKPIIGGNDLTQADKDFAGKLYPLAVTPPPVVPPDPPAPPEPPVVVPVVLGSAAISLDFARKQMLVRLPSGWTVDRMPT